MTDWPASPSRRNNLKLGACAGLFSQLFHWHRVVGGGHKYLSGRYLQSDGNGSAESSSSHTETEGAALGSKEKSTASSPQSIRSHESSPRPTRSSISVECFSSLNMVNSSGDLAVELRHLLDAKQEPFVLENVIREKRQPVRIKSSRGLKPEIDQPWRETKRSRRSRKTNSLTSAKDGDHAGSSNTVASVSYSSQRRTHAPAESIVSLPSSPGNSGRKSYPSTKVNCPSVSPVKSPNNKRALLMEAAVKILEGTNRSRKSLNSVRCLMAELEGNHPQEKPKEKLLRAIASRKDLAEDKKQTVKVDRMMDGKKQLTKMKSRAASRSKQIHGSQSENESGLLAFDRRLVDTMDSATLANASTDAEVLVKAYHRSRREDDIADKENKPIENTEFPSQKPLVQNQHQLMPECKDLMKADNVVGLGMENSLFSILPTRIQCEQGPLRNTHAFSKEALNIDSISEDLQQSSLITLECIEKANTGSRMTSSDITCRESIMLRLCDYSWWDREHLQSASAARQMTTATQQNSPVVAAYEYIEESLLESYDDAHDYPSPPAVKSPFSVKVFEDARSSGNFDVELSIPHSYKCLDECQQSSPVSILDAVFEEDSSEGGDALDYFEEAKQQLLENVRRFEMLAQMDLESLMKLAAEEQSSSDLEADDEDLETKETFVSLNNYSAEGFHQLEFTAPGVEARSWDQNSEALVSATKGNTYENTYNDETAEWHQQSLGNEFGTANQGDYILNLIERCKEGNRMSCNFFLDCFDEAAMINTVEVLDQQIHPWSRVPSDIVQELGKPTCSALMTVIDGLVRPDINSAKHADFTREVEEVSEEIENVLFGILMHELLTDLVSN